MALVETRTVGLTRVAGAVRSELGVELIDAQLAVHAVALEDVADLPLASHC